MQCTRCCCEIDRYASQAFCLCSGVETFKQHHCFLKAFLGLNLLLDLDLAKGDASLYWRLDAARLQDRGICRAIGIHGLFVVRLTSTRINDYVIWSGLVSISAIKVVAKGLCRMNKSFGSLKQFCFFFAQFGQDLQYVSNKSWCTFAALVDSSPCVACYHIVPQYLA